MRGGGRGGSGGRGGRGGAGGGRTAFVRNAEIQETPQMYLPRPEWPPIFVPKKRPFSKYEIDAINEFLRFRKDMRSGPLYNTIDVQFDKPGQLGPSRARATKKPKLSNSPFEAIAIYSNSKETITSKLAVPKLDGIEHLAQYFPSELHPTLNPSLKSKQTKPKPKIERIEAQDDELEVEAEEEEDMEEQEQDDDFEEDELDGDDYNAEQYFDNGEDDALEDDGGGDYE